MTEPTGSINSELIAAIVGGVIGLVGAVIGALSAGLISLYSKKKEDEKTAKAWLNGLSAEISHILKCIKEITKFTVPAQYSTKRMNHDFLEKARLILFQYYEDTNFLEAMTNAYRDIVHTNDMLDRYENANVRKDYELADTLLGPVQKCMEGVDSSVTELKKLVEKLIVK